MGSADSAPHLSPTITIALPWTAPSFAAVKGIIHAPGAFAPHLPVAPYHSGDRRWRSAQPRQGAALFQDPAGARSHETPRLSEPVGKSGVQWNGQHPMAAARKSLLLAPRWTPGKKLAARRICCFPAGHQPMWSLAACGGRLLLALQSQSFENAAIFRVELVFQMDFARRHIDEKIVRMRIDVGDAGDAQLPPALDLTPGVGFIINYDLQKFGFFRLEAALDGLDHAQRSPLGGTVSLKAIRQSTAEDRGNRRHTHCPLAITYCHRTIGLFQHQLIGPIPRFCSGSRTTRIA